MRGTYSQEKRPGLDSGSPYVHTWEGATTGGLLGGIRRGTGGRCVEDESLLLLLLLLLLLTGRAARPDGEPLHLWEAAPVLALRNLKQAEHWRMPRVLRDRGGNCTS